MLVLTRKAGQRIVIDDNIELEVIAVQGRAIRVGITAPREVHIRRGELQPVAETRESELAAVRSR